VSYHDVDIKTMQKKYHDTDKLLMYRWYWYIYSNISRYLIHFLYHDTHHCCSPILAFTTKWDCNVWRHMCSYQHQRHLVSGTELYCSRQLYIVGKQPTHSHYVTANHSSSKWVKLITHVLYNSTFEWLLLHNLGNINRIRARILILHLTNDNKNLW